MAWPAWTVEAWASVSPYLEQAAFWQGYEKDLQSLLIYGIGIAAYTALVFTFYQNLSLRDPFHSGVGRGWRGRMVRFLEALLVFPMMSFLYFGVLAISLFVLAKSQTTYEILLLSMSVVVGVRVTAFVSATMSGDLAKLLPLGLLGVLIVDPSTASLANTFAHFREIPALASVLARFFAFFLVFETVLKAANGIGRRIRARRDQRPMRRDDLVPPMGAAKPAARPRRIVVQERAADEDAPIERIG